MISRRKMMVSTAAALGGALVLRPQSRARAGGVSGAHVTNPGEVQSTIDDYTGLAPGMPGEDYTPVITPNLPALPWEIVDGVKVYHLVAEEMWHEFLPGLKAICWGYNGHVHGPTIEAVEGDRIRVYVTNRLDAGTTVHWHGMLVPNGMDGVGGLTQKSIPPGETFKYEFTLRQHGTLMYHSHHDEMTQMGMGMMGMIVVHPRKPDWELPERDYAIMLSEWRIDPGTYRPDTNEMSDFNMLTMNARAFPGTESLFAKRGERVRIRLGNLSAMDNHPIHLHGHTFEIAETDGGRVPESARMPMTTVLVPIGSTQTMEFIAGAPGDWALHCHMTHHVMNQMGHDTPNMIGVMPDGLDQRVQDMIPGYMTMGTNGMAEMGEMHMPLPENAVSMMGAYGPFGYITMGGMFTILKIRDSGEPGDYSNWYEHPADEVARAATPEELQRDGIRLPKG